MSETREDEAPVFGGGATRVMSESDLDGLLEATGGTRRAPKETRRVEAMARISAQTPVQDAAAVEEALVGAARTGPVQAIAAEQVAPRSVWPRVLAVLALVGIAAAVFLYLR